MARPLLGDDDIARALATVSWTRTGERLTKTVKRADFRGALAFVNAVGEVAEEMDHHPDITISWNTATLEVTTHDSGGLTASDFELARRIDALGEAG